MKKIYIFLSLLAVSLISYGANFSVAPTRFELDVDKVAINEVHILNNTAKPLRIETYFESDKDFGKEYNLNENIAVFPKVVAIKPGGRQTVRFRVKPGENLKEGESKSYIIFREVPAEIKSTGIEGTGENTSTNVSILTELGISIYGSKGEQIIKGRLENIEIKNENSFLYFVADTVSEGNTSIKFKYTVESSGGDILSEGKLGNSSRNGKSSIGSSLGKFPNMKGKKVTVKIFDQNDTKYYQKEIVLK